MIERLMRRQRQGRGVRMRARRHVPFVPLMLYYGAVLLVAYLLMRFLPGAGEAMMAPIVPAPGTDFLGGVPAALATSEAPWEGPFGRLALAVFTIAGAVVLALPIAGIYIHTRRLRYDSSLVQTMIVLPIVVAGVVLVVKNSLALAFALAGIVAGVRFRQKLNEPKDAVYVLLSLGLGLAAAVQALDIAFAVSAAFNVVVLTLWRFDPRSYAPATVRMGDTALLDNAEPVDIVQVSSAAGGMEIDGILVVYVPDVDAARAALDMTLSGFASEWKTMPARSTPTHLHRIDVLVRFGKSGDPVDLLSELEERWAAQIAAAEYLAFRRRQEAEDDDEED